MYSIDAVVAAIDSLSPQERVILSLTYFEDLSAADIAGALRISVDEIDASLARATSSIEVFLKKG